jgi:hypothetical protein
MKDIQNDLVRKKPKLKQLKIELPKQLTRLESELTSHPSNEELSTISHQQNAQQSAVSFGSLKVKRNDK